MRLHPSVLDVYGHRRGPCRADPVGDVPTVLPMQTRRMRWGNRWPGETAVVMASGPSLTDADIETVRQWREAEEGRRVIVTNTTFRSALWADVLFFHDYKWWRKFSHEVGANFKGECVTISSVSSEKVYQLTRPTFESFGNSGTGGAALAILAGCTKVVLLGCDAKWIGGKRHHFGDHPTGLGNAMSFRKWPAGWKRLHGHAQGKGVEVLNASRDTAIDCIPRVQLEDAL